MQLSINFGLTAWSSMKRTEEELNEVILLLRVQKLESFLTRRHLLRHLGKAKLMV